MTTNNGSSDLISISAAVNANKGGLSQGLIDKTVTATTTIKGSVYQILSVEFKKDTGKYFVKLLADNGKIGKIDLKPDAKIKITPLVVEIKPEEKIEAIASTPEKIPTIPDPTPQPEPKIDLSTLNAIASRLKADSEKIHTGSDEAIKAGQLLQRLECFKTDLLDYLFNVPVVQPESVPVQDSETPKEETVAKSEEKTEDKPRQRRSRKPKTEKTESEVKTEVKPTETRKERVEFLTKLKTINSAVKNKTMTAVVAAETHGLKASSISAVLAGYRLAIQYKTEILDGYIKGDYSWNSIRSAGQCRKQIGEKLAIAVATGKMSLKEAQSKAPKA